MSDAVPPSKMSHPRLATYHKLSEADHALIIAELNKFTPLYIIARKLGCGRGMLSNYIKAHEELLTVQQDCREGMIDLLEGKFMTLVNEGDARSIAFGLERLGRDRGWGQHQTIEQTGELPQINIGLIPDDQLPPEDDSDLNS